MMSNPDFNDPRNMKRDREGQERLSTHPDDPEDTAGHGAHYRHASFEQPSPDPQASDTLQVARDAGMVPVHTLSDDEARTENRVRIRPMSGMKGADASGQSPEMPEETR